MNNENKSGSAPFGTKARRAIQVLALSALALAFESCGPHYVAQAPTPPVVARPVAPYPNSVWIEGDWGWRGGRHVYRNGYWAHPRPGHVYATGEWRSHSQGYYYVRGRWR
jgi:WXXGXW repeat (2 copies)